MYVSFFFFGNLIPHAALCYFGSTFISTRYKYNLHTSACCMQTHTYVSRLKNPLSTRYLKRAKQRQHERVRESIIEGKNGLHFFFNRFIIFNNFDAIISYNCTSVGSDDVCRVDSVQYQIWPVLMQCIERRYSQTTSPNDTSICVLSRQMLINNTKYQPKVLFYYYFSINMNMFMFISYYAHFNEIITENYCLNDRQNRKTNKKKRIYNNSNSKRKN